MKCKEQIFRRQGAKYLDICRILTFACKEYNVLYGIVKKTLSYELNLNYVIPRPANLSPQHSFLFVDSQTYFVIFQLPLSPEC